MDDPINKDLLAARAETLIRMGQTDAAMVDLNALGTDKRANPARANALMYQGKTDEAAKVYNASKVPVSLEELPVWRRSLLLSN